MPVLLGEMTIVAQASSLWHLLKHRQDACATSENLYLLFDFGGAAIRYK
jgi:hypothetical protein